MLGMVARPPLWEKQADAKRFTRKCLMRYGAIGLFMEMGTGKTRVAVECVEDVRAAILEVRRTVERLKAEDTINLGLVAAPLSVMHVWVENWDLWADLPAIFIDLHETGPAGLRKAKRLAADGALVICLINYEMTWQFGHKRIERKRDGELVRILEPVDTTLYDVDWDFVILDEATAIKNSSAKVTKFFLKRIAPKARYRMALTGTAYLKRPLDVYPIIKFLTGEQFMPKTYTRFKAMYSIPHPHIRGAIIGYQNIPDLVARMAKCCVLLKKEEVIDLPPVIHMTREIELPPKVKRLYDTVTKEMYSELEEFEEAGQTITITHIFGVMRKQLQIASGFVIPDSEDPEEKPVPVELHHMKVDEVIDILEQRGGKPTIIVTQSNFIEKMLVKAIEKNFNFTPKVLNGSVKGAEARHKMIAAAANDLAFIVKESVGCEGTDMKYADMTIWIEHGPNTSDYAQMMARNHRGGQTKKITYVHIIARGTADKRVMKILNDDMDVAREIERNWRRLVAA